LIAEIARYGEQKKAGHEREEGEDERKKKNEEDTRERHLPDFVRHEHTITRCATIA
jgi:hypothetical protein